jgi:hypothetical protein
MLNPSSRVSLDLWHRFDWSEHDQFLLYSASNSTVTFLDTQREPTLASGVAAFVRAFAGVVLHSQAWA